MKIILVVSFLLSGCDILDERQEKRKKYNIDCMNSGGVVYEPYRTGAVCLSRDIFIRIDGQIDLK